MNSSVSKVVISGSGLYTPPNSISNAELVESFNQYVRAYNAENAAAIEAGTLEPLGESSVEFIVKASGIESRNVIDKEGILDPNRMMPNIPERSNEEWSVQAEMAIAAAKEALESAGKSVEDVDAIFVACSNFQRPYPAVSVEIQAALGVTNGFAYDMNVACSSATFGLQAAYNAVRSGNSKLALVISPEICSGHLNFRDRDSHFIFGDACTALVIEASETATSDNQFEILGTELKTVFSNNIRNNFGFLNRCDESGVGAKDKLFVQEGRKVFKEVCPMVAQIISAHLETLGIASDELKRMWLHQANLSMNQLIAKKVLGRVASNEEAPVILNEYANTSSAGSIIAFHKYNKDLVSGEHGVICSFGAGYSVGSVMVKKL